MLAYLLSQWGLPGLTLAAIGWWTLRTQAKLEQSSREKDAALIAERVDRAKEREALMAKLEAEHAARLTDAQQNTKAMLDLSDQVHATVDRISWYLSSPRS